MTDELPIIQNCNCSDIDLPHTSANDIRRLVSDIFKDGIRKYDDYLIGQYRKLINQLMREAIYCWCDEMSFLTSDFRSNFTNVSNEYIVKSAYSFIRLIEVFSISSLSVDEVFENIYHQFELANASYCQYTEDQLVTKLFEFTENVNNTDKAKLNNFAMNIFYLMKVNKVSLKCVIYAINHGSSPHLKMGLPVI